MKGSGLKRGGIQRRWKLEDTDMDGKLSVEMYKTADEPPSLRENTVQSSNPCEEFNFLSRQ
jgi:hypothetical protein